MACWPTESRRRDRKAACLALTGIFFIAGTGCMQLVDLPRVPALSAGAEVPPEEAGNKKYRIDPRPLTRKAPPNPVKRPQNSQQRVELSRSQSLPLTTDREAVAKEDLQSGVAVSMDGEAHARSESMPAVMAQMTGKALEKGSSIFLSEAVIFLLVGAVFLLVHLSMRRRLKPDPNTRLAKLLHTRPWR